MKAKKSKKPQVAIIMGSKSDLPVMKAASDALKDLGIAYSVEIVSAHRTPHLMMKFAESAHAKGYQVIIAGAGGAAHLPGMVASVSVLPVIGVPVSQTKTEGLDSLLSIVQMPKGVPVATVAIDNAYNAGLLAARILAVGDSALTDKLKKYQKNLEAKIMKMRRQI